MVTNLKILPIKGLFNFIEILHTETKIKQTQVSRNELGKIICILV